MYNPRRGDAPDAPGEVAALASKCKLSVEQVQGVLVAWPGAVEHYFTPKRFIFEPPKTKAKAKGPAQKNNMKSYFK